MYTNKHNTQHSLANDHVHLHAFISAHNFITMLLSRYTTYMSRSHGVCIVSPISTLYTGSGPICFSDHNIKLLSHTHLQVDAITDMIAYPDQILNDTYLDWVYAEVSLLKYYYIPRKFEVYLDHMDLPST